MTKYFTKEQVMTAMGEQNLMLDDIWGVEERLDELPAADVVEVVRCKDCRHYTPWSDNHDYGYGICDFHEGENVINRGFCSEGKRKEGENNE